VTPTRKPRANLQKDHSNVHTPILIDELRRFAASSVREDQKMDEVAAAAWYWGVEPEYFDGFSRRHLVSAATLERLVAAVSRGRDKPVQF
jgi:hypothetical protein